MPIDFPDSPTTNQIYSSGNRSWIYDGTAWVSRSITAGTGSITETELAANAVTTAKIAAGAVVEADIATDAVTTNKIANSAVTGAKLAATAAIQPTIVDAKGDLIVGTADNTVARQAVGANGSVLMADSAQTNGVAWSEQSLGYRNVVINGAMQIHQRGTSTASITTSGYRTADRWRIGLSSMGTWTQSVENDAPTGSGFRKSLKILCTTADASPAAADIVLVDQGLEGQNVQHFFKGTASARSFTLSFWVKSNVTGTYIAELIDSDNTRQVSASYTITAVDTWQRKIINFPADTTGAFDNDNARSLTLSFGLGAGSNATSGTLNTVWGATINANQYVGQTNVASAVNNYWQITGVQLEAGSVATPFEFEDYGTTLVKCERYYQLSVTHSSMLGLMYYASTTSLVGVMPFVTTMRTAPTLVAANGTSYWYFEQIGGVVDFFDTMAIDTANPQRCRITASGNVSGTAGQVSYAATNNAAASLAFSSEL